MDETHTPDCLGTHPTGQACDASQSPPGVALGPLTAAYQSTTWTGRRRLEAQSTEGTWPHSQTRTECGPRRPSVWPYSSLPLWPPGLASGLYASICVGPRPARGGHSFHHQDPTDQELTCPPLTSLWPLHSAEPRVSVCPSSL